MTEQQRPDASGQPVTRPTDIASMWDAIAETYDQQIKADEVQNNTTAGQVLENIHCDPRAVLDLASGTGLTVEQILRHTRPQRLVAVDISEQMLKQLRRKHPDNPRIVPIQAPINDYLAMCNESFDLITAVGIIPQLSTPADIIERGSRLLNRGGYMLFNYEPIILGNPDQEKPEYYRNNRTGASRIVRRHNPDDILGLIQQCGLEVVTRQRYSSTPRHPSQQVDIVAVRKPKANR